MDSLLARVREWLIVGQFQSAGTAFDADALAALLAELDAELAKPECEHSLTLLPPDGSVYCRDCKELLL